MVRGLENKRVVVTAGAAGIGRAIAEGFHQAGARVHICDVDESGLAALAEENPEIGRSRADVSDPDQIARLFEDAERHLGGLDVLINNAGIAGPAGPTEDCGIEDWRQTLAVNLDGAFLCLRHAIPMIKAAGAGSIVNISSTAGLVGSPDGSPSYTATKGAVRLFTKSTAIQHAKDGIRCNSVHPGPIDTEMIRDTITDPDRMAARMRRLPMGRVGTAADIAYGVLYLASDEASFVTGTELVIDGGTTAQ